MKKNLSNIYTTNDYINFNESSYDNTKSAYYERALIISDFIKKNKIKSVLDVGCSTGSLIKFLKKRNKYTNFYGCDISPMVINKIKKNPTLNSKNFFTDDVTSLKTSKSFDLILCFGLFQFIPNPLKVINKLSKNLNKNAYLVIATQNFFFTFVSFNQIAANFLKKVTNLKNKKFLEISKYFIKNKYKHNVNNYFTPIHNNIEILNTISLSEYFKEKNYEINYVYSDYYNYHSKFLRTNKKNFTSQKNKWKKNFFSSAALHIFKKTL